MSTKGKAAQSRGEGMGAFYRDVACRAYPKLTSTEADKVFYSKDPATGQLYGAYGPGSIEDRTPVPPAWNLKDLMAGKYTDQ